MARVIEQLDAVKVRNKRKPGYHVDGGGLYLQVSRTLSKSWIFRYKRDRKRREMGLGSVNAVSLLEARDKALACRKLLDSRIDPIDHRKRQMAEEALAKNRTITFRKAAETYISLNRSAWKNRKHAQQWENTLATYAYGFIGDLDVADVDTPHVLQVLEPIWRTKRETAGRLRGRILKILDWAKAAKHRVPGSENPARWIGHLDILLPKVQRIRGNQPALPYVQISAFCGKLSEHPGISSCALEFLILTAMRTFPVTTAERREFDLKQALWTIPAWKMKGKEEVKRDHRVALSSHACEIIRGRFAAMAKNDRWIFPGRKADTPLNTESMAQLVERMNKPKIKWTDPKQGNREVVPHGFRSSFKDWAAEETDYPNEISEMALAHAIGNKTEESYRRGDLFKKRRALMEDWAKYCSTNATNARKSPRKR
jgi:integrase